MSVDGTQRHAGSNASDNPYVLLIYQSTSVNQFAICIQTTLSTAYDMSVTPQHILKEVRYENTIQSLARNHIQYKRTASMNTKVDHEANGRK